MKEEGRTHNIGLAKSVAGQANISQLQSQALVPGCTNINEL